MTDRNHNPFASPRSPALPPPSPSWIGWYEYDPLYSDELGISRISFTMSWNYGWFGRFCGAIQDGPESDMQEIGQVKGFFRNSKVEFTKYMPVETLVTAEGRTIKTNRRHPSIHYYGRFDSDVNKLVGRWYIVGWPGDCSGSWEAAPVE